MSDDERDEDEDDRAEPAPPPRTKKKKKRRLWGDGKGKFRTQGSFSSATVRGTRWLTEDSCNGTLTKVKRGTVTVRDFAKKRNVTVRAGKQYFARKK